MNTPGVQIISTMVSFLQLSRAISPAVSTPFSSMPSTGTSPERQVSWCFRSHYWSALVIPNITVHFLLAPQSTYFFCGADSNPLPCQGWRQNVGEGDQGWIGQCLFMAKGKLSPKLKLWWHPPSYELPSGTPLPKAYHHKRLFLWMPRRMWQVDFRCPNCHLPQSFRSKDVYNHVRMVMDTKDFYYMAGEYMDCRACNRVFVLWDSR